MANEIVLVDKSGWSEQSFNGNPLVMGSNAFSSTYLRYDRTIPSINYLDIKNQESIHNRWTRKYRFEPGIYEIQFTTDDGVRIYANNSLLDAYKNGQKVNSWIEQDRTVYTFRLDTSKITFDSNTKTVELRIEHFNAANEWDAVLNYINLISLQQPSDPTPQPYIPPPPPPPPPPLPGLENILVLSKSSVDRQYVKGTLTPITSDVISVGNQSDSVTISVNIESVDGIVFTPKVFNLPPKTTQQITISFVPEKFENYNEGLNKLTSVFNVSALSVSDAMGISSPMVSLDTSNLPIIIASQNAVESKTRTFNDLAV